MDDQAFTSFYKYEFNGRIQQHSVGINKRGELFYTVIFLPDSVTNQLPLKKYPRLRVEGEMHDLPFQGALQPAKGRWYLLLSQRFLKENHLSLGNEIDVRFNIGDQDHVEMPIELQQALDAHEAAKALWNTFTPGKKRGFATTVSSAKRAETRQTRAEKMIQYILEGKNPGGR
ncbi:MAG: YdeI/OmpD-associated family protein [Chloroflexota bacterium]